MTQIALRSLAPLAALATYAFATTAMADTEITVGHDWWVGYSGVFVAEDQGFFKDEGLDVTLQMFASPSEALPPLIAGHVDIGMTTLHNLLLVAGTQGQPFRVGYFLDASNGADAIIAQSDFSSLADLEGHKIAVNIGDLNHMFLIVALEDVGMTEEDVDLVNMAPDAAGAAYMAGNVDAAVTWEPWLTRARQAGGNIVYSTAEPAAQNLILNGIVATETFIEENPGVFESYIRAVARGVAWMQEHPDEAYEIVGRKLEVSADDTKAMVAADHIYDLEDNVAFFGEPGGVPPIKATMERVLGFLQQREMVTKPVDIDTMIDRRFVDQIAAE